MVEVGPVKVDKTINFLSLNEFLFFSFLLFHFCCPVPITKQVHRESFYYPVQFLIAAQHITSLCVGVLMFLSNYTWKVTTRSHGNHSTHWCTYNKQVSTFLSLSATSSTVNSNYVTEWLYVHWSEIKFNVWFLRSFIFLSVQPASQRPP